jgi:hypothetical protein
MSMTDMWWHWRGEKKKQGKYIAVRHAAQSTYAIHQQHTLEEPFMCIYEINCGLASCKVQNPLLVIIPLDGIVTLDSELQCLAFHQGPIL